MLTLTKIAELDVSAASGLVVIDGGLCVVADDELFLARYDLRGRARGRVALFAGELPEAHAERKRRKPDLESLCVLPGKRLLALGSGSSAARQRAVVIDVARGFLPTLIDLSPLYAALAAHFAELNIEGVAVQGDALWLAQRGNGAAGKNGCIELDLACVLDAIERGAALPAAALRAVFELELPQVASVKLSLTDLAPHPRGLLFSAAAEASANTYDDGECVGSAIGLLSVRADLIACELVAPTCKLEGITAVPSLASERHDDRVELLLVADPDDRAQRAPLFSATLALA